MPTCSPVVAERDGRCVEAYYVVDDDTLTVRAGEYVLAAPLLGSNPDVLAHVLLDALLDDLEERGVALDDQ